MPEQYGAVKRTLGELLSTTGVQIEVSEFQREYSWEDRHVEQFWLDLMAFAERYPETLRDQEYFLGAIVLVEGGNRYELLDGQQRLATATILLSVIRDVLNRNHYRDAAIRTQQKFIADTDDATGVRTTSLTLNRYDRDFFRREVQESREADYVAPTPQLPSHHLIRAARELLESVVARRFAELGGATPAFQWLLRTRQLLTDHVSLVRVTSLAGC